jgi:hypothetical protein
MLTSSQGKPDYERSSFLATESGGIAMIRGGKGWSLAPPLSLRVRHRPAAADPG